MANPVARDAAIRAILRRPFAQQSAFFRGKLGNLVPTARWTDMQRSAHDRGFMVAGAQSADLLAGLAAAVDRAITEGVGINQFRKDFKHWVKQSGWDYTGDFNWRTRTIYRTNLASSYAAGRNAQLREGAFPYLMYKHGGSADPRPEHLSWDGLVLPSEHPFWRTHFAPNGWGCSCRIIGVRSLEAARRLGGSPDKPLPQGWDATDPATGAPPGIDAGWDYRPGDTVATTVQQMAAKTQQWDYTLAKAYMENVPDTQRDALALAYRALPSVATDTRLYAQRIIENRNQLDTPPYRTLGLLTSEQSSTVRRLTDRDVNGFDYAIDLNAVMHVQSNHGHAATEARRGQRAVTAADFARLPEILSHPDSVSESGKSWRTGHPLVRYQKMINGEEYHAVFEVRARRRSLALDTLFVKAKKP